MRYLVEYFHYDPFETNRRFYRRRKSRLINLGGCPYTDIQVKGPLHCATSLHEYFRESDRQFNAANPNRTCKTVGPKPTDQLCCRHKWQTTNALSTGTSTLVPRLPAHGRSEIKSQEENTNQVM